MSILTPSAPSVRPPDSATPIPSWRDAMKNAVRDPEELCKLLGVPYSREDAARDAATQFTCFAPRGFIARMKPGDPNDPLLRQVLPVSREMEVVAGFTRDPVGDLDATQSPGVLRKYAGRALLVTTGACAIHCRYCFRRHFPYEDAPKSVDAWRRSLELIAADSSVHEVILSGGDPLTLVDSILAELAEELARVAHLRRIRIHTRLPIVIPERVTDAFIDWLTGTRLAPIVVVHANHVQEIDASVERALGSIRDAGVPVLNQTVLLAGVNDSTAAQFDLCERLIDIGVTPYYLHLLDPVAGAAHFDVPENVGRTIIDELRARLPGYGVPRLVREVPGAPGKTVIA